MYIVDPLQQVRKQRCGKESGLSKATSQGAEAGFEPRSIEFKSQYSHYSPGGFGECISVLSSSVVAAAAAAKSRQSCPTLCDPIDGSPPGSSVPGILQARTLEWVAISFSNA